VPFLFQQADLPGVVIIEPKVFADARGFFVETFKQSDFHAAGMPAGFVQENHSKSVHGTLRGLHFQRPPKAQGKLVRTIVGEIFDVAADVRPESPTFGNWVGVHLTAANKRLIFIPPGYAHGFCVLSDEAEVIYKTTEEYAPALECGVRWDDPALAIDWPISNPLLSARDEQWEWLAAAARL
jgi:dTDP-4-dehydrorhamnose 3,5-epimerase